MYGAFEAWWLAPNRMPKSWCVCMDTVSCITFTTVNWPKKCSTLHVLFTARMDLIHVCYLPTSLFCALAQPALKFPRILFSKMNKWEAQSYTFTLQRCSLHSFQTLRLQLVCFLVLAGTGNCWASLTSCHLWWQTKNKPLQLKRIPRIANGKAQESHLDLELAIANSPWCSHPSPKIAPDFWCKLLPDPQSGKPLSMTELKIPIGLLFLSAYNQLPRLSEISP